MRTAVGTGLCLAALSAGAWCLVLIRAPLPDTYFSELEARRNAELEKRAGGSFSFWTHEPIIFAAREVGPFIGVRYSVLMLATFPAVVLSQRQAKPASCAGLPLLKQESIRAFRLVIAYSAAMWFLLGFAFAGAARLIRVRVRGTGNVRAGAG